MQDKDPEIQEVGPRTYFLNLNIILIYDSFLCVYLT